ncbi:MAG: hypothetical protein RL367_1992, partial [Pseudomonadota bacterium]
MDYRRDIDGLRAIAVLSVMLFHAGVPGFSGGFAGVDVFFVISGFLITGIISRELDNGRFSILNFYERRVRRIVPVLLTVIAVSLVIFSPLLLPEDLRHFGQSVVATIGFGNNALLWKTAGYFDPSVEFKPLSHTWSLGVEEQYYLLIPLAMTAAWRWGGRKIVIGGIAIATLASFAFALHEGRIDPLFNFYLITSRFWELGAGSLAAFAAVRAQRLGRPASNLLALAGLVAVLVSVLLPETRKSFPPNAITLIPVGGTCLVLLFSNAR